MIIGVGGAGKREIDLLHKLNREAKIYILNTGRNPYQIKDNEELVESIETAVAVAPEFVYIATPTSTHLQYADKFLGVAKVILIEKPMDSELGACEVFVRNSHCFDTKVYVNYQRRYLKCWQFAKKIISEKAGEFLYGVVNISSYYPDWRPDKKLDELYVTRKDLGGGVLLTECHEIDLVGWIIGEITSVNARVVDKKDENAAEDRALAIMDIKLPYGNRSISIVLDDNNRKLQRTSVFVFDNMTVYVDEMSGIVKVTEKEEKEYEFKEEVLPQELLLRDIFEGSFSCLPSIDDALQVSAVVYAIKKSAESLLTEEVVKSVCPAEGVKYLEDAVAKLQKYFGNRLIAIYGLGSLGYGGYVKNWSDFDIDVLIDTDYETARDDYNVGKEIEKQIIESGFERIDIRVYSYEHLNVRKTILTYGQCSRATMLCDSGVLLAGKDVRDRIIRPTIKEQNAEAVSLLRLMLSRGDEWWEALPWEDIAAHFALVARFMYTKDFGEVAGKQKALEYYINNYSQNLNNEELQWENWALMCRLTNHLSMFNDNLRLDAVRTLRGLFGKALEAMEQI